MVGGKALTGLEGKIELFGGCYRKALQWGREKNSCVSGFAHTGARPGGRAGFRRTPHTYLRWNKWLRWREQGVPRLPLHTAEPAGQLQPKGNLS